MMKITFIILLLMVSFRAFAPTYPCLLMPKSEGIDPYKPLRLAIGMVECRLDTLSVNPLEQAYGYFQIRKVRLDDYYRRTGIVYSLKDMLDYNKAVRVFNYYVMDYHYSDAERISRCWNGGPNGMKIKQTWDYWKKVRKHLII